MTSSSVVNAVLEAARDIKSPIILQISQGGAAFFAGKGLANGNQEASIAGAVAAAHFVRAVAPSYGVYVPSLTCIGAASHTAHWRLT